ncbi:hypothetical protein LLE87_34515, partial [Paenibacillus polymyxa]|nr:hypothetical protein [Paenibacillus polymyxa]
PIKAQLGLSETQFGLLAAMPVLTGSLVRVPLGIWTDRYGGRPVFFVDDHPAADQTAQDTLEEIARSVGFSDIEFQFEPLAAAFDYE